MSNAEHIENALTAAGVMVPFWCWLETTRWAWILTAQPKFVTLRDPDKSLVLHPRLRKNGAASDARRSGWNRIGGVGNIIPKSLMGEGRSVCDRRSHWHL